MIYVWCQGDCDRSEQMFGFMLDYLNTPLTELLDFKLKCKKEHTSSTTMRTTTLAKQINSSEGYNRLNYETNTTANRQGVSSQSQLHILQFAKQSDRLVHGDRSQP